MPSSHAAYSVSVHSWPPSVRTTAQRATRTLKVRRNRNLADRRLASLPLPRARGLRRGRDLCQGFGGKGRGPARGLDLDCRGLCPKSRFVRMLSGVGLDLDLGIAMHREGMMELLSEFRSGGRCSLLSLALVDQGRLGEIGGKVRLAVCVLQRMLSSLCRICIDNGLVQMGMDRLTALIRRGW